VMAEDLDPEIAAALAKLGTAGRWGSRQRQSNAEVDG